MRPPLLASTCLANFSAPVPRPGKYFGHAITIFQRYTLAASLLVASLPSPEALPPHPASSRENISARKPGRDLILIVFTPRSKPLGAELHLTRPRERP